MALLPTSQRDQKMLLVCIAALGLGFAYWYLLWTPANTELDGVQGRVEALRTINQTAKSELAQGKTAQLRSETEQYAKDLDVMRELVPTANEVPVPLEQVSTAACRRQRKATIR